MTNDPNVLIAAAIAGILVMVVAWRVIKKRRRVQAIGPMSTWGQAPLKVQNFL